MLKRIALLTLFIYPVISFSAIQILTTRVVVNAAENEQTFVVKNTGDTPSLLQLWLSNKNDEGMEIKDNFPLIVTPPIARVNSRRNKVFRIFSTPEALRVLPGDRESVFWVNVLDIPSMDESADKSNRLGIAFRTRIKVFYRPKGLTGLPEDTAEKLVWSEVRKGNNLIYTVKNRGAYHVSFARLSIKEGEKEIASIPGGMVEPFSSESFTFNKVTGSNIELNYQYITDLGAFVTKKYKNSN